MAETLLPARRDATRRTVFDPAETAGDTAVEERSGRGRIGLVVLFSILFGLVVGLVLCLGVFGGRPENVITGAALLSLGLGFLMLYGLARWRTDQPQPWAFAPAVGLGVAGLALLALGPGDRMLGRLGWLWPLLLALLIAWSARGAHRFLHNWSRRALLYPSLGILGARRAWRSLRVDLRGNDDQRSTGGPHLSRRWPQPLSELYWLGFAHGDLVQRTRRADTELGMGDARCHHSDPRLRLRPGRPRLERQGPWSPGCTRALG